MRGAKALLVVTLLVAATVVLAQDQGGMSGTVTFRGGKALAGKVQLAELGVVEGAGIGNSLPGHGSIVVKVGDQTQRINGDDIASVTVEWTNSGSEAEPRWEIKKLSIVKKDGTKVDGAPDWLLHATNVWVVTAEGKTERVHVFPFGGEPFSPDSLIAKIDLAAAAPAAPPTPARAEPTAPAVAPAEPAAPAVAPAEPAAPAVAPTAPAAPAAPAGAPAGALLAQGTYTLMVRCPKCGEWIKIVISAEAVSVEHAAAPGGK
jgi:hypothetical protein